MTANSVMTEGSKLASTVIFTDIAGVRFALLVIGFLLGTVTFFGYIWLIVALRINGRNLTRSKIYMGRVPSTYMVQEALLTLGIVVAVSSLVQMCCPELASVSNLFQGTYKALSYYFLMHYCCLQYGDIHNMIRDDLTGTVQSHEPYKIWARPPCCCVWSFFFMLMKRRTFTIHDLRVVYYCIYQCCVLAPVLGTLLIVVNYRGVEPGRASFLSHSASILSVVSLMTAAYGSQVMLGVHDRLEPVVHQLQKREWFTQGAKPTPNDPPTKNKDINMKASWLALAGVLPSLAGLVVSFFVVGDSVQSNGDIIRRVDMESHISGFVSTIISFLAFVFAVTRAFPRRDKSNSLLLVQICAKILLEYELMPNSVLELLKTSIEHLLDHRKNKGIDGNFGDTVSPQWKMLFAHDAATGSDARTAEAVSSLSEKEQCTDV